MTSQGYRFDGYVEDVTVVATSAKYRIDVALTEHRPRQSRFCTCPMGAICTCRADRPLDTMKITVDVSIKTCVQAGSRPTAGDEVRYSPDTGDMAIHLRDGRILGLNAGKASSDQPVRLMAASDQPARMVMLE